MIFKLEFVTTVRENTPRFPCLVSLSLATLKCASATHVSFVCTLPPPPHPHVTVWRCQASQVANFLLHVVWVCVPIFLGRVCSVSVSVSSIFIFNLACETMIGGGVLQRVAVLWSQGCVCSVLQCVVVCCSVLQCVAVCCSALELHTRQHTATRRNTRQHTATHCNTLQHNSTHCNTLQHTATHCNTL